MNGNNLATVTEPKKDPLPGKGTGLEMNGELIVLPFSEKVNRRGSLPHREGLRRFAEIKHLIQRRCSQ